MTVDIILIQLDPKNNYYYKNIESAVKRAAKDVTDIFVRDK